MHDATNAPLCHVYIMISEIASLKVLEKGNGTLFENPYLSINNLKN